MHMNSTLNYTHTWFNLWGSMFTKFYANNNWIVSK